MKNLLILALVFFIVSCKNENTFTKAQHIPSKIDSLETEAEVEAYINETDSLYNGFRVKDFSRIGLLLGNRKTDSISRSYAKNIGLNTSFYKVDFNNDGLTDIMVLGTWGKHDGPEFSFNTIIIINGGKDKSQIHNLLKTEHTVFVPELRTADSLPFVILHHPKRIDDQESRSKDSAAVKLLYHAGYFIEYNRKPQHHKISKIRFRMGPCFGTCPSFEMHLEPRKDSWFIAKSNNFSRRGILYDGPVNDEGSFKTRMSDNDFTAIEELLNYINFENLSDEYSVMHTDAATAEIEITYNDGKIKRISDYGTSGTYGLVAFYRKMMSMRFNEKWTKAKEPSGIRLSEF